MENKLISELINIPSDKIKEFVNNINLYFDVVKICKHDMSLLYLAIEDCYTNDDYSERFIENFITNTKFYLSDSLSSFCCMNTVISYEEKMMTFVASNYKIKIKDIQPDYFMYALYDNGIFSYEFDIMNNNLVLKTKYLQKLHEILINTYRINNKSCIIEEF